MVRVIYGPAGWCRDEFQRGLAGDVDRGSEQIEIGRSR
jgi:hypothetical protein